ncbi:hypothetical protein ACJVDH_05575 [Pedobacter sp. AW1-32]|uniref:hypothetical protein n=1 Tax=Pedobacter sp. AW1-32 TaxID=3383026 RepID=UPI003FF0261D
MIKNNYKLTLFAVLASTGFTFAQNKLENSGNVGIGTLNPLAPLHVSSENNLVQLMIQPKGMSGSNTSVPSYIDFWSTFDNYPSDQGPRRTATIRGSFSGGTWGTENLSFHVGLGPGVANDLSYLPVERMRITGNGNVGIGTTSPSDKLSVNGNIRAREIKVDSQNWPDYVFNEDYSIPSLSTVEQYIKKHKHLPEMPSAKTVETEGLQLGEMNKMLLKKIEELTLYLIEIKKENKTLNQKVEILSNKIN